MALNMFKKIFNGLNMFKKILIRFHFATALFAVAGTPALAETARMADNFVDSIGVNTHLETKSSPYWTNFSAVVNAIKNSGIRHIRDGFWTWDGANRGLSLINQVQAAGGKVSFLFTETAGACNAQPNNSIDPRSYTITYGFSTANIDAFEGLNEWNGWCHGQPWPSEVRAEQQWMANLVRGTPNIASIPIVGPSLLEQTQNQLTNDANRVGNLTGYMTYGNAHDYTGASKPSNDFSWLQPSLRGMNGGLRVIITETGYTNAQVSQSQANKYYSRLFFEFFNQGFVRTYAYELFDEPQLDSWNGNFGLLNANGSYKPAMATISNIIALLKDPGPSFTPAALSYTLSGGPAALHHTLLQKRNGTFYLVLWLEYNYWDGFSPAAVTINFAGLQRINQYDPLTSVSPVKSWNNVQAVTVTVSDQATILEINSSVSVQR